MSCSLLWGGIRFSTPPWPFIFLSYAIIHAVCTFPPPTEVPCYILNLIFKDTPIRRAWWRRKVRSSWTKRHFTTCCLRVEWTPDTCGKADKGFRDEVCSTVVRVGYKLCQLGGQHCKGVTWSCCGTLLGVTDISFYHLKVIITESGPWVKLVLRNLLCISDNTCTIWGHLRPECI